MKWWPDSLFGRLIAAIGAVVIAIAAVIALLIVREHNEFELRGSGLGTIADEIAQQSRSLAALAPARRAAELQRQVGGSAPAPHAEHERAARHAAIHAERTRALPRRAMANRLADRLRKTLGSDFGVTVQRARRPTGPFIAVGPLSGTVAEEAGSARLQMRDAASPRPPGLPHVLQVDVRLPDGAGVTFRTLEPEPGPQVPRGIFRDLLLLFLLVAVVLFWMTRSITRPLRELESAADALGRGQRSVVLRESGARELRNATRAFNAMQERLNRYLDGRTRVLAAMSHDLRTPLTRLRLRAETLADDAQRERFVADLDEMTTMVNQALQLFRGQESEEEWQDVDVRALIDELAAASAEIGDPVTVSASGRGGATLHAQPHALRRCIENLLDNARRYGGGARIELVTDANAVAVRVIDRGPGIPVDELTRVFEPFYRGEASRNASTGGTGLGLGLARDVAQAHGGTLTLRNAPDGGLVAELRLPRRSA